MKAPNRVRAGIQPALPTTIQIAIKDKLVEINSLTVEPKHFKKGIAGKLLSYVLEAFEFTEAVVETAVVNKPAINLYKKQGFVEFKQWTPSHGIEKIALSIEQNQTPTNWRQQASIFH